MNEHVHADLTTLLNPRSPISEAYRSLRTNIEFSSLDDPLHTLVVTSAGPEEGKSTTLANLAVATAQAGKRVILADCDLRKPSLHTLFGFDNDTGITSMVVNEQLIASPPLRETEVPGLFVLCSGALPPNPSELLASRRMEEIIKSLTAQADIVFLDAPPVVAVTDAAVLASKVDGVLLVIRVGKTRREHARRAVNLLQKVNARLIGSVLNNAPFDSVVQGYYTQA